MLREFRSAGTGESLDGEFQPPMDTAGRPPAKATVVPIRSRAPPAGTLASEKFTTSGELPSLNIAIGSAEAPDEALTVPGCQFDIRTSDGCMVSILLALRKPAGVPTNVPSWNSVPLAGALPDSAVPAVCPAATVTVAVDPTASSPA